jgi:hypothetical protein
MPAGESDKVIDAFIHKGNDLDLLQRMIDHKVAKFKEYTNFIIDYEVKESKTEDPVLSVITQEEDAYLAHILETLQTKDRNDDFVENFIDRHAIIIKPKQPFIDWYFSLYPYDPLEFEEIIAAKTYLISDEHENIEKWLNKKFDKIFMGELESWHFNKKEWPQKRNYKMFKEWFQIDVSSIIYDMEKRPITKCE